MQTKIFDYGMNAEGVAKHEGKIILIKNALIDEDVDVEIVEEYQNYSIGKLKKVIVKSNQRVDVKCPYFYECGGCDLQHMSYQEQLKYKTKLVQKTIKKIANLEISVANCVACDNIFKYRNKASFNFKNNLSGFYKNKTNTIVEIEKCIITSDNINNVYSIFKNTIDSSISPLIKHLVVREINNQILVGVVSNKQIDLQPFYNNLKTNFEHIGLYLIINTRKDSVVLSGKIIHIAGIKEIKINNFDLTYSVDLLGFHQTNLNIQNKIYNKVLEYISPSSTVVNGFSGQGLLSAILAKKAKHVYGIEINKSSHKSAEKLKNLNKITNLTNTCGDFNNKIKNYINSSNILILDPSKKGCGKEILSKVNGIKNIIYISCNPIALAKDLRHLTNYEIEEVIPFDMFPNTNNVETLVKLKIK